MKKKDVVEMRTKSLKELSGLALKTQKELVLLRAEAAAGKLKDTQAMKKKQRDLARMKTILRAKELAGEVVPREAEKEAK